MPFGRDYEYASPSSVPTWMEDFARKELEREAAGESPFHELRSLFQRNKELSAVEAKVRELKNRIGFDLVSEDGRERVEKTASLKTDAAKQLAELVNRLRTMADDYDAKGMVREAEAVDMLLSMALEASRKRNATIRHVERAKERGEGTTMKWCVYPKGGGDALGCHSTKKEAEDQLAAIEANKADDAQFCVKMVSASARGVPLSVRAAGTSPFDQDSRVQRIIDNIVWSRRGHVSPWAIIQKLRSEFARDVEREKVNPDDPAVRQYISDKVKETREDVSDAADDVAGLGAGIQISQEDEDLENRMFDTPSSVRR